MIRQSQVQSQPGLAISFVEIDSEMFSTLIPFLPLIQERQLSLSGENVQACPGMVWLGKLPTLNMTLMDVGFTLNSNSNKSGAMPSTLISAWLQNVLISSKATTCMGFLRRLL